MVAGNTCWEISLWWEAPLRVSKVVPRSVLHLRNGCEVRDEGGGDACAGASVRELHFENQN